MGRTTEGIGVVVAIVVVLFAASYGISYLECWTYAGRTYDVTVKVANVERSEHLFVHTNVWVEQFIASTEYGPDALKYRLEGHQFLNPGETYRIVFTDKVRWHWWKGYYIIGVDVTITPTGE